MMKFFRSISSKKSSSVVEQIATDSLVNVLLSLIVNGKQEQARQMLLQNPELLLERGEVTDRSGRVFKNITVFDYVFWALDAHMFKMLISLINDSQKATVSAMCDVIEREGLPYDQNGMPYRSKHFDFTRLTNAYFAYINAYDKRLGVTQMITALHELRAAQADLPMHAINEYCMLGRKFLSIPNFDVDRYDLPRETKYFDCRENEIKEFPFAADGHSTDIIDLVLFRGMDDSEVSGDNADGCIWGRSIELFAIDYRAMMELGAVRLANIRRLSMSLVNIDETAHLGKELKVF